jgi:acetyl/propionyl-CoA carboxylase alpha subunit
MQAANVPVIPGYHGDEQSVSFLKAQAEKIGQVDDV